MQHKSRKIYSAFSYVYFNSIARPANNQQGDLYHGFLFNLNRQLHVPSEMPSLQVAFQNASGYFTPMDYGTIYGPGPSSRQAIDLQDFTCASPSALESSGSSQSLSLGPPLKMIPMQTGNVGTVQR